MPKRVLAKEVQTAYEWLKHINDNIPCQHKAECLAVLRAVLHSVRDHMPNEFLAHFSAQLPLIIRGILFENWKPSDLPIKDRKKEDFIQSIQQSLISQKHSSIDAEKAARVVMNTLSYKLPEDEIDKIMRVLPKSIRHFFDV